MGNFVNNALDTSKQHTLECNDKFPITKNSKRGDHWIDFANRVLDHIERYTVPQYGDFPNDQLTEFTQTQCIEHIKRYCNRANTNVRGASEAERDLFKIAHYAQVAWTKLRGEEK